MSRRVVIRVTPHVHALRATRVIALAIPLALAIGVPTMAAPAGGQIAQERVDLGAVSRIRQEGLEHSQIPELARHLTDVIGPRLTGSPGMKAANEWTAATLRSWGLDGVTVEPW